jgi:hypothetical protein
MHQTPQQLIYLSIYHIKDKKPILSTNKKAFQQRSDVVERLEEDIPAIEYHSEKNLSP